MCLFCSYLGVTEVIQTNEFVYKSVCELSAYLLGVVFVCNCLFLNDFIKGFCCSLVIMFFCVRDGLCVCFLLIWGCWSGATE